MSDEIPSMICRGCKAPLFTGRGEHDSGQFDGGEEPLFGQAFARGEIFQFLDLDCQNLR